MRTFVAALKPTGVGKGTAIATLSEIAFSKSISTRISGRNARRCPVSFFQKNDRGNE
jgi:hypothetical protein